MTSVIAVCALLVAGLALARDIRQDRAADRDERAVRKFDDQIRREARRVRGRRRRRSSGAR